MKDLAYYILSNLVDDQDAIHITQEESDQNHITLTLQVAEKDMGKVIGKKGNTIRAIREVIKILALKQNKYVNVILAE